MTKKKRLKIEIEYLPNGYALNVDSKRYMYHTVEELTAGYFAHVMLSKTDYMNTEMIKNMMTAAAAWPTVEEAITANAVLLNDKEEIAKKYRDAYNTIQKLQNQLETVEEDLKDIRERYKVAIAKLSAYQKPKFLK